MVDKTGGPAPQANGSAQGSDGTGGAGTSNPAPPPDPAPTKATVLWDTGLPALGITSSSSTSGTETQAQQPVGDNPFFVDIGGLRSVLRILLSESNLLTGQQNALADLVHAASTDTNIWGQNATQNVYFANSGAIGGSSKITHNNDVDDAGAKFRPQIQAMMDNALNQVDDALYTLGQFMAMLEQSAQDYGDTDASLQVPTLPALVGPDDLT